jgi:glycosyltransferase involved in cell wall biosynthesis
VARLEEVKGHEYFIRAARRLVDKGLKAKFFICGVGENENELKSLAAELNMQDYIIFTGFVKNISKILNITHIMANCSFGTEATSLALLEAMSLGIPIIATDYGGNCDVVEDGVNGCIIPTKSAAAFVQAAEKIIWNSGMIAVMRKNAIEIYEQKFTANIMAKNIESVYKKIFENA